MTLCSFWWKLHKFCTFHFVSVSVLCNVSHCHCGLQAFHTAAYKAEDRRDLLRAMNEFLDDSVVLPPGDWDRKSLLPVDDLKKKYEDIRKRKMQAKKPAPR